MIDKIRAEYREMQFLIKQRIRADNALAAHIRTTLGWSLDKPEAEREAIRKQAEKIIKEENDPRFTVLIALTRAANKMLIAEEARIVKSLERSVKTLPIWKDWAEGVKGFGAKGMAVIIGVAGDLNDWHSLPGLYKRLGLAPFEGKACSTWRMERGLSKEDWIEAGYSPKNRAAMYAYVGEPIIRQGPYAEVYKERRKIEDLRCDRKMTAHLRAHRYATKKLIKHLFHTWRKDQPCSVERPTLLHPTPCMEQ